MHYFVVVNGFGAIEVSEVEWTRVEALFRDGSDGWVKLTPAEGVDTYLIRANHIIGLTSSPQKKRSAFAAAI